MIRRKSMGRCINEASAVIWIHGHAGSPVAQGFIDSVSAKHHKGQNSPFRDVHASHCLQGTVSKTFES